MKNFKAILFVLVLGLTTFSCAQEEEIIYPDFDNLSEQGAEGDRDKEGDPEENL